MNRGRIAYITQAFPSRSHTFVQREILNLIRQGWDVSIFALHNPDPGHGHDDVEHLTTKAVYCPNSCVFSLAMLKAHLTAAIRKPGVYFRTFLYIVRKTCRSWYTLSRGLYSFVKAVFFSAEASARSIQYIHTHFAGRTAEVALLLSKLQGIGFSFIGHSQDIMADSLLFKEKVEEAAFVLVATDRIRQAILRKVPQVDKSKVHIIHTGVDTAVFDRSGVPEAPVPTIVSVARLEPTKGIDCLIEACVLLQERGRDFECLVIGDGSLREKMASLIELRRLGDWVKLMGHMPDSELMHRLRSAWVFALPCVATSDGTQDGLPVSLIEAMSVGLPVVSTRLTAIPELVDDDVNGILVTPGDVTALVDALDTLLSDADLRRRLGRMARRKVIEQFEVQRCVQELGVLFEAAIGRGHV